MYHNDKGWNSEFFQHCFQYTFWKTLFEAMYELQLFIKPIFLQHVPILYTNNFGAIYLLRMHGGVGRGCGLCINVKRGRNGLTSIIFADLVIDCPFACNVLWILLILSTETAILSATDKIFNIHNKVILILNSWHQLSGECVLYILHYYGNKQPN